MSVTVLLSSLDMLEGSHSSSSGSVSSDGFGGPHVSSLCGTTSTSSFNGRVSLLLEMEVGLSSNSTDSVGVAILLTSCGRSSRLYKKMM